MIAQRLRQFKRVVGIDLGGGKGKHTAVAVGEVTPAGLEIQSYGTRAPAGTPWYDAPLTAFLLEQPPQTLIAMDAPLGLPACIRCTVRVCPGYRACPDPVVQWMREQGEALEKAHRHRRSRHKPQITPYTQRVCEIRLRCEDGIQPRETLGQGMGPLTARAAHLRRALAGRYVRDRDLLEVYPKATIHQLAGAAAARRYKRETDIWGVRAKLLETFSQALAFQAWREESLRCDHCFDAVVCAYSGWLWMTTPWTLPAGMDEIVGLEGWIWRPEASPASGG
jgi:predicted RNase H-like nuclease